MFSLQTTFNISETEFIITCKKITTLLRFSRPQDISPGQKVMVSLLPSHLTIMTIHRQLVDIAEVRLHTPYFDPIALTLDLASFDNLHSAALPIRLY